MWYPSDKLLVSTDIFNTPLIPLWYPADTLLIPPWYPSDTPLAPYLIPFWYHTETFGTLLVIYLYPADTWLVPWSDCLIFNPTCWYKFGRTRRLCWCLSMFHCLSSALMRMASWRIWTRHGFDTKSVTPGATPPLPSPSRTWQVRNRPTDWCVTKTCLSVWLLKMMFSC